MNNVTVTQDFFDGTLADDFAKLGYPPQWKRGERRTIPDSLVKAVTRSGGQITIADDSAKESKEVVFAEPAVTDGEAHYRKLYKSAPRVTVFFPEGFKDGTLSAEFVACDHPSTIGVGEIVSLPQDLLAKIKESGGLFETSPEVVALYRNQQGKHQLKVRQFLERMERGNCDVFPAPGRLATCSEYDRSPFILRRRARLRRR